MFCAAEGVTEQESCAMRGVIKKTLLHVEKACVNVHAYDAVHACMTSTCAITFLESASANDTTNEQLSEKHVQISIKYCSYILFIIIFEHIQRTA